MRIHLYSVQRERDERVSEYDYNSYSRSPLASLPPERIHPVFAGDYSPRLPFEGL